MSGREIDAFLEERLNDIDELIQSELGFAPLNVTEPFNAPEICNLSFLLEREGTSVGLLSNNILGNEAASSISGQEWSNKVSEVEVEIQLIDFKDVYNKKTKKTDKGLKYCLEDSEVTVVAQASDEITSIQAYTQRCVEAAIRTHDTVGPVELDVNILQSDPGCRVVVVDLGSVFKTREGDAVYRLEKADVMERNKWEMLIAMEFSSGLKGTVKTGAYRVTTKAKYKIKRNAEDSSSNCTTQRLFSKFTWYDNNNNNITDLSGGNNFLPKRGINQEFLRDETCAALNRELMAFNLTEEDHCETRGQCADDSRTDLKSRSGSSAEEKILLQHHTVLDRHMVTTYYGHNPKICYVIEQSDLPGMLKLVGKRSLQVSAGHKTDWRNSTKQVFWWACGRCFFERQKKSSIKAHIIQRVCQRPINVKAPRRKSASRHLSQSELQEDTFEGYSLKDSLSV